MPRLIYSRQAERDLDGIFDYTVGRYGGQQAITYTDRIRDAANTIAQFPMLGRAYTTKNGREFRRFASGRHMIFYQIEEDTVFVVRILYDGMDFDSWL